MLLQRARYLLDFGTISWVDQALLDEYLVCYMVVYLVGKKQDVSWEKSILRGVQTVLKVKALLKVIYLMLKFSPC